MDDIYTVIVSVGDDEARTYQVEAKDDAAARQIARKHLVEMIDTKIGDKMAIVEFDDAFIDGSWRGVANV